MSVIGRTGIGTALGAALALCGCDALIGLEDYETEPPATAGPGGGGAAGAPAVGGSGAVSAYAEVVLADKPMGYWRLGEQDAATVALDASTFGRDGVYESVDLARPALIADRDDTAVAFGELSGLFVTPDFHFAPKQSFSAELWLRPHSLGSDFRHLVGQRASPNGEVGWSIGMSGGTLRLRRSSQPDDMAWDVSIDLPGALSVGETYYIVASYDERTGDLCIEARPGARLCDSSYFEIRQTYSDLTVWGYGSGSSAVIDEVAVYNEVLPPDRIDLHHSVGLGRP